MFNTSWLKVVHKTFDIIYIINSELIAFASLNCYMYDTHKFEDWTNYLGSVQYISYRTHIHPISMIGSTHLKLDVIPPSHYQIVEKMHPQA